MGTWPVPLDTSVAKSSRLFPFQATASGGGLYGLGAAAAAAAGAAAGAAGAGASPRLAGGVHVRGCLFSSQPVYVRQLLAVARLLKACSVPVTTMLIVMAAGAVAAAAAAGDGGSGGGGSGSGRQRGRQGRRRRRRRRRRRGGTNAKGSFESGKFTLKITCESGKLFTTGCRLPPKSTNFGTLWFSYLAGPSATTMQCHRRPSGYQCCVSLLCFA